MDIRSIKTFVRAAELKSITKAAEEMNYVQSTVTTQIKQLEKELGYPLFDRIGKRISLTCLGEQFLSYAYEMLKVVHKAETLHKNAEDIKVVLRVGVAESLLLGVFMDLLPEFKGKYKNVDLRIKSGHTVDLLEGLKQNDLDMVYISKAMNTDADLECHYSHKENLIFVAGKEHPLARETQISVKRLMEQNFLVTEREGICYSRLSRLSAEYGQALKDFIEVDNVFVITQLVKRGLGLAFLPEYAVAKEIEKGDIVKLNVDIEPQVYFSQILCHKNRWISPYVQGLIDMISLIRR